MSAAKQAPMRRELQHAVLETNRRAGPSDADRARITGALRARLGASVVPEGFVPRAASVGDDVASGGARTASDIAHTDVAHTDVASGQVAARSRLGRRGWLGVVAGTGVIAGALGFVLGHAMAQREGLQQLDGAALPAASVLAEAPLEVPVPAGVAAPSSGIGSNATGRPAAAEPPAAAEHSREAEPGREPDPASDRRPANAAREGKALAPSAGSHTPAALRVARPLERSSRVEGASVSDRTPRRLSFADVLERLQRANLALRQGQAALSLIQLAELDRAGGETLREEREVTRVLALCAIGDEPGARRAAGHLLAGAASSIYAPRLATSCARPREP